MPGAHVLLVDSELGSAAGAMLVLCAGWEWMLGWLPVGMCLQARRSFKPWGKQVQVSGMSLGWGCAPAALQPLAMQPVAQGTPGQKLAQQPAIVWRRQAGSYKSIAPFAY